MAKLLLITSDFPPRRGGVATYYRTLVKNVLEMEVLTNIIGAEGERVHQLSWSWPGWPKWLPLLWLIPIWKIKTKAEFLAAGEILPLGTALMSVRLAFGWRYLVFVHGLDIQLATRNAWKRWLTRQVLKYSCQVVVNSNFTRDLVIRAGGKLATTTVVYPAVRALSASQREVNRIKAQYQLAGKKVVLTVARLVLRKGISQVIKAMAQVQSQQPEAIYVVVGDGPLAESLRRQAAELSVSAVFTGSVSDNELAAWYESADVFVLTPIKDTKDVEGFGIVYLEAMARAKAVVASRVGGVAEAVGEAGILINDHGDLAAAIVKLLPDNGLRLSFESKARARAAQFSEAAKAHKVTELIKNLKS